LRALRGESSDGLPFLPLVNRLAAKVVGCGVEEMQSDPGLWTGGVTAAAKLLSADAVAVAYDPTITAEGLGSPIVWKNGLPWVAGTVEAVEEAPEDRGRMRVALEVMRRAFPVVTTTHACVAMLTGPVSSATMLFGREAAMERVREAKASIVRCVEAVCETRPDLLLFMEGIGFAADGMTPAHKRIYSTMRNIASYYNIPVGLFLRGYGDEDLSELRSLGLDILALGSDASGDVADIARAMSLANGHNVIPFSLPPHCSPRFGEHLDGVMQAAHAKREGMIAIVAEPDEDEIDVEELRSVSERISKARI
jgi:hypothetical protein